MNRTSKRDTIVYCLTTAAVCAEVKDGRIRAIYTVTNPEKLSRLPPPPC